MAVDQLPPYALHRAITSAEDSLRDGAASFRSAAAINDARAREGGRPVPGLRQVLIALSLQAEALTLMASAWREQLIDQGIK